MGPVPYVAVNNAERNERTRVCRLHFISRRRARGLFGTCKTVHYQLVVTIIIFRKYTKAPL